VNPENALSVALVEDDDATRTRLAASVAAHPRLRLIGQYSSGEDALEGLRTIAPDVLLVDLGLGRVSGLEVIRSVARTHPQCDILVITVFGDEEHVLAALQAGARGYLLKGDSAHEIAGDIEQLSNGGSPLSPIIARQVLKRLQTSPAASPGGDAPTDISEDVLTEREREILRTIARGFTYAETAGLLKISTETVHTHLKRIYRKLAVNSKTEAVFEADVRRLL
jgi:DNA-binding NarL/FixJ family response regulator